ncbi:MAG TPA: hypothetical protein VIL26_08305 [Clostridia bacterium]
MELESLEKEKNELKQENAKLQQLIAEQKKLIDELKQKLDAEYSRAKGEFAKKIRKLEKENEQLKAELEADKNELTALRELAFSLQQEPKPDDDRSPSVEEMCRTINSPAILIVGGYPGWQKQIKDRLPNINVVAADMLNFDPDNLGTVELIVFNTAFLNHGMYYKVINFVRKNKVKVCYIVNQNIEKAIEQIWQVLNNRRGAYPLSIV